MKASVRENSSSVSPGKPVMRSVVSAQSGKAARSRSVTAKNAAVVYFRCMRESVASHPDCRERWKCGHTLSFARRAVNSSVTTVGSSEPRWMRTPGAAAATASSASMSVLPFFRSLPHEAISMPVTTISL